MTTKLSVILFVILAVVGCAVIMRNYERISQVIIQRPDRVSTWASHLGVPEPDMLQYLERATGIPDRAELNDKLANEDPNWSAFYKRDTDLESLIHRYDGIPVPDQNIATKRALQRIAKQMKLVRSTYLQDNQVALNALPYGLMLQYLAGSEYSRLGELTSLNYDTAFLLDADAEIWKLIRRFVATIEDEIELSPDLRRSFAGIRFDEPLMVVERMRHQPVVRVLLTAFPTHVALGELFETLQKELPRP